jgi:hypothetical protein
MVLGGSILATNTAAGPCGGTALAVEPFPAIFVSLFGFALILCSYFLVKKLKVESSFRATIYLFLVLWSLTLPVVLVSLAWSGVPRTSEDVNDLVFSLLRGTLAVASLIAFFRWTGVRNLITRVW